MTSVENTSSQIVTIRISFAKVQRCHLFILLALVSPGFCVLRNVATLNSGKKNSDSYNLR
jgi:hypothetical protein